jgi:prepilin-type N-terminal cleavage/methylation domain-containing protein
MTFEEEIMRTRNIRSSQDGFTLIELLVAMALIVLLMTILTESFSEGARRFDDFKAIGDLDEKLDDDQRTDEFHERTRFSSNNIKHE